MTTFVYESTLANGAAVDSALGKAETALQDAEAFATAAQGALADTAVQPGDLGSAAAADVGDFATAAQGGLADSAVQPDGLTFAALTDVDPSQEPDGQVLTTASGVATWAAPPVSSVPPAFTAFV